MNLTQNPVCELFSIFSVKWVDIADIEAPHEYHYPSRIMIGQSPEMFNVKGWCQVGLKIYDIVRQPIQTANDGLFRMDMGLDQCGMMITMIKDHLALSAACPENTTAAFRITNAAVGYFEYMPRVTETNQFPISVGLSRSMKGSNLFELLLQTNGSQVKNYVTLTGPAEAFEMWIAAFQFQADLCYQRFQFENIREQIEHNGSPQDAIAPGGPMMTNPGEEFEDDDEDDEDCEDDEDYEDLMGNAEE